MSIIKLRKIIESKHMWWSYAINNFIKKLEQITHGAKWKVGNLYHSRRIFTWYIFYWNVQKRQLITNYHSVWLNVGYMGLCASACAFIAFFRNNNYLGSAINFNCRFDHQSRHNNRVFRKKRRRAFSSRKTSRTCVTSEKKNRTAKIRR